MKAKNLFSLACHINSNKESCIKYLKIRNIELREYELEDLFSFIKIINNHSQNLHILDNYYVGFKIPQIGKEFDLLRLGKNFNINIELKSENTGEKMHNQLIQNKYYLKALKKTCYHFTYVSDENNIYILDDNNQFIKCEVDQLIKLLESQEILYINDIYSLFEPTQYLVSPFNSPEHFLNDEYFLTEHQQKIKKVCIESIKSGKKEFFSIQGNAGTGKTLLTYDIAKELITNKLKVLIIHVANLNLGQEELNKKDNWKIIPIKLLSSVSFQNFDCIIVDEAQRIKERQLDNIIKNVTNKIPCIFSFDQKQYLSPSEDSQKNKEIFLNLTPNQNRYQLTEKIRTNKEIANFIKYLFYPKQSIKKDNVNYQNISIHHFSDINIAKTFINYLMQKNWTYVNYTTSSYDSEALDNTKLQKAESSVHSVLGQEFDNMIVLIDEHFFYNENCKLRYNSKTYYLPDKMLFQTLTRARKKLALIFINNTAVYQRALDILESSSLLQNNE